MHKMNAIREEELLENGGPFLPVCLCLDTSGSMGRQEGGTDPNSGKALTRLGPTRLELLQKGVEAFYDAVYSDEMTRYTVEVAIVTFSDGVRKVKDFSRLERMRRNRDKRLEGCGMLDCPELRVGGQQTRMGDGVNLALDLLEQCKRDYVKRGVDYFQPWLVLISDGGDTGSPHAFERARGRIAELVSEKRLAVYPMAIGSQARIDVLNKLSPVQQALSLESISMPGVFRWLAKSAEQVSGGLYGFGESPRMEIFEMVPWLEDYCETGSNAFMRNDIRR